MPKEITLTIPDEFIEPLEAFLDSEANDAFDVDPDTNARTRKRKFATIEDLFEQFTRARLGEIAMRHPTPATRARMVTIRQLEAELKEATTPPPLKPLGADKLK